MPDAAGAAVMEEISTRVVPSKKQVFDFRKVQFSQRFILFHFGKV